MFCGLTRTRPCIGGSFGPAWDAAVESLDSIPSATGPMQPARAGGAGLLSNADRVERWLEHVGFRL